MANERRIARLLNELWNDFLHKERAATHHDDGSVSISNPPEEEQKFFDKLLMECRKDMRESDDFHIPNRLTYWRHKHGDDFFSIGWLDPDGFVTAVYTIDTEEDVSKRWIQTLKTVEECK